MLHEAAFRAAGMNATYSLFPTSSDRLEAAIRPLATGELAGLNVTVPHKLRVIELLDELADSARLVGAVNTVRRAGTRLVGHNTDVAGFRLQWTGLAVPPGKAVVLGAGGAARAAVSVLLDEGRVVTVVARHPAAAEGLAWDIAGAANHVRAVAWSDVGLADALSGATAVVNATPLADALPAGVPIPPFVADLVAWPVPTVLEARARAAGCRAMGGIVMLIGQAAEAFALWTGLEPPVDTMRRAAVEANVLAADVWPVAR
jgi:shikimate dehydrogenase